MMTGYLSWVYLLFAIVLEVTGTISMKLSQGFSKPLPSAVMLVAYLSSLALLTLALKTLDVSVAYAIWAGLGTALVTSIGILWFHEPATAMKLASIAVIVFGVVALNLSGAGH